MANDIRTRLREATGADHLRLEDRLDIFARISTPSDRLDLVRRFMRLHAGAEAALAPHLDDMDGLSFSERRRTVHLRADLAALGGPEALAHVSMPPCGSQAEALGVLYVLEGSTLGGRFIRRRVEAEGGDMKGLSFLDPYGEQTGERWRAFLEVLDRETTGPNAQQAAVAGALAGFRHAEEVLCGARVEAA